MGILPYIATAVPIGIGVFGMFIRIERRLTRIETNVSWLMRNQTKKGETGDVRADNILRNRGPSL